MSAKQKIKRLRRKIRRLKAWLRCAEKDNQRLLRQLSAPVSDAAALAIAHQPPSEVADHS